MNNPEIVPVRNRTNSNNSHIMGFENMSTFNDFSRVLLINSIPEFMIKAAGIRLRRVIRFDSRII
jgi:hypothetical protein